MSITGRWLLTTCSPRGYRERFSTDVEPHILALSCKARTEKSNDVRPLLQLQTQSNAADRLETVSAISALKTFRNGTAKN